MSCMRKIQNKNLVQKLSTKVFLIRIRVHMVYIYKPLVIADHSQGCDPTRWCPHRTSEANYSGHLVML